ncbi:MAG: NfeD family protein [Acidimicrobiia bacterium]
MSRRLLFLLMVGAVVLSSLPASGQADGSLDVIKLSGPLDERAVEFALDTIIRFGPSSELIIIQLDSPAAVSGDIPDLLEVVADPPAPLAVWVGPQTAVAYGGGLWVLEAASVRMAAPGVNLGAALPMDFGLEAAAVPDSSFPAELSTGRITVDGPIDGLVEQVHPSLSNVIQALDGSTVAVGESEQTLAITEEFDDDGEIRRRPIETRFHEPGIVDRALRLSLSPAIAYLFLLVGLSVAAFEFYAAGVGVAAAVSVLTLALSGYGIAVLPVNWWALGLGLLGLGLYLLDFQRIQMRLASLLGTVAMLVGARYFVHEPPQLSMAWWSAALIVLSIALFFLFAMTTVVRARFSTPTIGREHLIGKTGKAETAVAPDGVVVVDGARWKANSRRASGIEPGDPISVASVEGFILEVDPIE